MDPHAGGLTRIALWHGAAGTTLEELPSPAPGPGEVLVRVRLATVCGSDRHTVAGRRDSPHPGVLGHEAVGVVQEVGAGGALALDGTPLQPGRVVVWGVTVACHQCDRCLSGLSAKCRSVRKVGHEPFAGDWPLSGTYATHIVLPPGATVVVVPPGLPDAVAAPAACATATVMSTLGRAGDLAGRRVLVSGAGMLGLTAAAAATEAGAREVVVSDLSAARLQLATRFGATATVLAGRPLPAADVALEFSGAAQGVAAALDSLDIGGRLVLAGSVSPGPAVALDPERVVRRWLTVSGVHNYEPHHLQQAVELLSRNAGGWPWTELVGATLPLGRVAELLGPDAPNAPRTAVAP